MTQTSRLLIDLLDVGQREKEATINAGFSKIDAAVKTLQDNSSAPPDLTGQITAIETQLNASTHGLLWEDLVAPLSEGKTTGQTAPNWSQIDATGVYAYEYTDGASKELQVSFHIRHDYAMGTVMYPHVHWLPSTTNTGVVRWVLTVYYAKGHSQEAFFTAPQTIIIEQAASGTAFMHQVAEGALANITSRLEPDGILIINVKRDGAHANDTFTGSAFGLQCDIHYQANRNGTINKAPNFYA